METLAIASDYEIERGKPMPSKHHAIVQASIGGLLFSKYPNYWTLPELSISFNGEGKVPDLAIYDKENFESEIEEIRTNQIPLGAIEILSPTQNINELIDKSEIYFQSGVKSYWLVVPVLKTIFVFSSLDDYAAYLKDDVLVDDVLGIRLDLKLIF
jgi:Uma2 family endonuclease